MGGLTVYAKLKKLLPNENYIYFGDTKNMPYGEKTADELMNYAKTILEFFEQKQAKAVVMACNTTSSVIYDKIKDKYDFKIYPIVQSCAKIIADLDVKKIGIFATNATVKSNVYKKEIQKHNSKIEVIQIACPDWVRLVEENRKDDGAIEDKVKQMLEYKPDKIVLGCTHYPYLIDTLAKFAPKDMFIDPSVYFAEFIKNDIAKSAGHGFEEIYVSANPMQFMRAAEMFYRMNEPPKLFLG